MNSVSLFVVWVFGFVCLFDVVDVKFASQCEILKDFSLLWSGPGWTGFLSVVHLLLDIFLDFLFALYGCFSL